MLCGPLNLQAVQFSPHNQLPHLPSAHFLLTSQKATYVILIYIYASLARIFKKIHMSVFSAYMYVYVYACMIMCVCLVPMRSEDGPLKMQLKMVSSNHVGD